MPRFSQKTEEELRLFELRGDHLEIKIAKERDELIHIDVVNEKLKQAIASITARLDVIPKEVVYTLVPDNPHEIEQVVRVNIDKAKEELAGLLFETKEMNEKLEAELSAKLSKIKAEISEAKEELEETKKAVKTVKKTATRRKKAATKKVEDKGE